MPTNNAWRTTAAGAPDAPPEWADSGPAAPSVCMVGPGWRFASGVSCYTCRLANALADLHNVSVVQIRRLLPRRFYPGRAHVGEFRPSMGYAANIPVFNGIDWWWGSSIARAISFIWRRRPDVLLLQWWTAATLHTYLLLAVLGRLLGARVVLEMHESQDPGESGYFFARCYGQSGLRLLLRLAHGVLVHSQADRELFQKAALLRDVSVLVAPHGPYDQYLDPAATAGSTGRATGLVAKVRTAPRPSVTNLLSFGLIRPYKGLEDLLEAFAGFAVDEVTRFWLTIVGEAWENGESVARLIEKHPYRDRITFVNEYVPDAVVSAAFEHADMVILPYRRSSSSGVLHIAMSYGVPVVLTSVGGLPEAVGGYDGAILVQPGDPRSIREGIKSAAKLTGQRFPDPRSWQEVVEAVLCVAGSARQSALAEP